MYAPPQPRWSGSVPHSQRVTHLALPLQPAGRSGEAFVSVQITTYKYVPAQITQHLSKSAPVFQYREEPLYFFTLLQEFFLFASRPLLQTKLPHLFEKSLEETGRGKKGVNERERESVRERRRETDEEGTNQIGGRKSKRKGEEREEEKKGGKVGRKGGRGVPRYLPPNMSEALSDEIEAINSIYGPSTLIPSPEDAADSAAIYILSLPQHDLDSPAAPSGHQTVIGVSLRIHFPGSYPDAPPSVLGTYRSAEGAKRGEAARQSGVFVEAIGEVFVPGVVCLFDAIERAGELLSQLGQLQQVDDVGGGHDEAPPVEVEEKLLLPRPRMLGSLTAPGTAESISRTECRWTLSDSVTELKSVFVARCATVSSPAQATQAVADLLAQDKRVRSATHNITAWRIRGPNGTSFQDCDDDGETAAGGRLLHLMQLMDLWDVMVVVTRWYGGQKLGPRRFALINAVARDAFAKAGLVVESTGTGGRKKGHK